jgi:integrase/recombinase XerD
MFTSSRPDPAHEPPADRPQGVGKPPASCPNAVANEGQRNTILAHSGDSESAVLAVAHRDDEVVPAAADNDARLIGLWLHGRPTTTKKSYLEAIQRFTRHAVRPLGLVRLEDLQKYADSLNENDLAPATKRRLLAAVKSLFAFGHRLGYFPFDTARPLHLPALRDTLAERVIDESSLLRMIDLEPNPRNAAILSLMYAAGLRVSELVGLRWRDIRARSNGRGQITVLGKGQKTRTILLSAGVFSRLLAIRETDVDEAPVFTSRKKGGSLHPGHVLRITKRAARRAGIGRVVRNHDLRHSHATHSLERGAPISLVSQTLGHASISTTGKYLHARPDDSSGRFLPL